MTYSVEKTAKTVQDAIAVALEDLKVSRDKVDIEIIDEGNKGIFGIIGNKLARIRVFLKEESANEKVQKFLSEIFTMMNINIDVEAQEDNDTIRVKLLGDNMGIVIGRRGETLDSLQYLCSLIVNKGKEDYKKVVIDIKDYRQKREETLIKLANRLADKVIKSKKNVVLEPMNPYERRIIHSALQENKFIDTHSIGEEPNRKVIIKLK